MLFELITNGLTMGKAQSRLAILIIFIPTVGDYVTPQLVGGTDGRMLSNMIQSLFGRANNFPLGAASAVLMLTTVCLVAALVTYITKKVSMRMS